MYILTPYKYDRWNIEGIDCKGNGVWEGAGKFFRKRYRKIKIRNVHLYWDIHLYTNFSALSDFQNLIGCVHHHYYCRLSYLCDKKKINGEDPS